MAVLTVVMKVEKKVQLMAAQLVEWWVEKKAAMMVAQ